jgi:hypothetical protein
MPDAHSLTLRQADQARTDFATINVGSYLKTTLPGAIAGVYPVLRATEHFLFQGFGNIFEFRLSVNEFVRSFAVDFYRSDQSR